MDQRSTVPLKDPHSAKLGSKSLLPRLSDGSVSKASTFLDPPSSEPQKPNSLSSSMKEKTQPTSYGLR